MKVSVFFVLSLNVVLASGFFREVTDWRTQFAAWEGWSLDSLASLTDDDLVADYAALREQAVNNISVMHEVSEDVAVLLYGDWNVDRIKHVNRNILTLPFATSRLQALTMTEACRFLPDSWRENNQLVDLLKKIITRRFTPFFKNVPFSIVVKALGDFNDGRIKDFARIIDGEWKYFPVTMNDLCSNLSRDRVDAQLESFFRSIMMKRASEMFDTENEGLLRLAFDNFNQERVEYLREMMLNHWTRRRAIIEELTRGLPEQSLQNEELLTLFHEFRFRTFVIHNITTFRAYWLDLIGSGPLEDQTELKLQALSVPVYHALLKYYVKCRKVYPKVLAMGSVKERQAYLTRSKPVEPTEQEISQALELFRQKM